MSTLDRVKFTAASSGTGAFVVSAAVTGWLTPAGSGMANAQALSYIAFSSDQTQWEYGHSTYTVSGTSIARSPIGSSNSNATVSFTSPPTVAICLLAEDFSTVGYTQTYGGGASQILYQDASSVLGSSANLRYDTVGLGVKDTGATFLGGGYLFEVESTFASGATVALFRGTDAGTGAFYDFGLDNGTYRAVWRIFGTGFTTSGNNRQSGVQLTSNGPGGITLGSVGGGGAVYFISNNVEAYTINTSGQLISVAGTAATNTTTGDLQLAGGAGIVGALYVGSTIGFGQAATGATTALLGTGNCPATTGTAPYAWMTCKSSDGSTVYVPAWK